MEVYPTVHSTLSLKWAGFHTERLKEPATQAFSYSWSVGCEPSVKLKDTNKFTKEDVQEIQNIRG